MNKIEKIAFWLLGFALMIYLILRAIYTPILHDEIATFYYYIQTGAFIPPNAHWDANNHILNSLLSHWSFQLFGSQPWALRLPNVLSFSIYFIFTWKLVQMLNHKGLRWGSFLALVMSHYVFEYFGETRGYGLSMAFLVAGLFYGTRFFNNRRILFAFLAMFFLFLAVSANLTIVYIYLMVLTLLVIGIITGEQTRRICVLHAAGLLVFAGTIVLPLIQFSLDLKERGALYYGGKSSFMEYTLSTLSYLILGSKHNLILFFLIGLTLLILFLFLKYFIENRKDFFTNIFQPQAFYATLFFGSLTAIFATRYLLDVNFPEDRTALYLYPLFVLSLAFSFEHTSKKTSFLKSSGAVLFAYLPLHFLVKTDISKASFSMEERAPQEYFDLISEAGSNSVFQPTVGGYQTQSLCWYFMNYLSGGRQNSILFSSYPDTICDYQILNIKSQLPKNFLYNYKKINSEPVNDLNLFKRIRPVQRILVAEGSGITNWEHQTDEFMNLLEYDLESSDLNSAVLAEISGILHAPSSPFQATITISQKKENGEEISQERFVFNWLQEDWNDNRYRFHQSLILPNISREAKVIQIFIWNMKKKPFFFQEGEVKLFRL